MKSIGNLRKQASKQANEMWIMKLIGTFMTTSEHVKIILKDFSTFFFNQIVQFLWLCLQMFWWKSLVPSDDWSFVQLL